MSDSISIAPSATVERGDGDGMIVRRGFRKPPRCTSTVCAMLRRDTFSTWSPMASAPCPVMRIELTLLIAGRSWPMSGRCNSVKTAGSSTFPNDQRHVLSHRGRRPVSPPPLKPRTSSHDALTRIEPYLRNDWSGRPGGRCRRRRGVLAMVYANMPEQFYPAYLTAYMYWLGMALGCMGVAMLHGLTGGAGAGHSAASSRPAIRHCR